MAAPPARARLHTAPPARARLHAAPPARARLHGTQAATTARQLHPVNFMGPRTGSRRRPPSGAAPAPAPPRPEPAALQFDKVMKQVLKLLLEKSAKLAGREEDVIADYIAVTDTPSRTATLQLLPLLAEYSAQNKVDKVCKLLKAIRQQ